MRFRSRRLVADYTDDCYFCVPICGLKPASFSATSYSTVASSFLAIASCVANSLQLGLSGYRGPQSPIYHQDFTTLFLENKQINETNESQRNKTTPNQSDYRFTAWKCDMMFSRLYICGILRCLLKLEISFCVNFCPSCLLGPTFSVPTRDWTLGPLGGRLGGRTPSSPELRHWPKSHRHSRFWSGDRPTCVRLSSCSFGHDGCVHRNSRTLL